MLLTLISSLNKRDLKCKDLFNMVLQFKDEKFQATEKHGKCVSRVAHKHKALLSQKSSLSGVWSLGRTGITKTVSDRG